MTFELQESADGCWLARFPREGPQTGQTTRQMQAAPLGAHYVWTFGLLDYPRKLADRIGRTDLVIVRPSFFEFHRWTEDKIYGIVVDHAVVMNAEQKEGLMLAETQVVPLRVVS